jgi:hypothetical protein
VEDHRRWPGGAWTRLPALALVLVAAAQIALARWAGLDPWSGGGFGMFASTDAWARRHLHAYAIHPGLRRELEVPEALEPEARRLRALPTEARLRRFALRLAEHASDDDGPLEAVSIQVFAARWDRSLAPSGELLVGLRVPVARDR